MEMDSRVQRWRPPAAGEGDGTWRPLDWPALCARLAAARHLRRALLRVRPLVRGGSFDPATARRLAHLRTAALRTAAQADGNDPAPGLAAVNLEPSAIGKPAGDIRAGRATS